MRFDEPGAALMGCAMTSNLLVKEAKKLDKQMKICKKKDWIIRKLPMSKFKIMQMAKLANEVARISFHQKAITIVMESIADDLNNYAESQEPKTEKEEQA